MMHTVAILFDVDGTLLITGGASSRCMSRAGATVFGSRFHWSAPTAGLLDPQILIEVAGRCGIEATEGQLTAYKEAYLGELEQELDTNRARVRVLPGIQTVLGQLAAMPEVRLGILTGNYRRAAELKLAAAGLPAGCFCVGAFAEDAQDRSLLVSVCQRQLRDQSMSASRILLVGDTPRDILCARSAGCRVLAVATGQYTLAELDACHPDLAVQDLGDPAPLYDLVERMRGLPAPAD